MRVSARICGSALVHKAPRTHFSYPRPLSFPFLLASPHVIGSMLDAIEAMRVALGPGIVLNYVLQGLWHPARRVREVFWQIYSTLYMGSQDALVPYYPTSEFF